MANLENISTEDLRQILAEVDDGAAVQRLMAAITYKEIDDLSQKAAAELYGFSESWGLEVVQSPRTARNWTVR